MHAIVNNIIGHIQSKCYSESENSDEVLYGMCVEILKDYGGWCYIKTHYNYEGYINKKEILINENKAQEYENEKNAVCVAAFADILDCPEAEGHQIMIVTRGAMLIDTKQLNDKKNFTKIKLADGRYGWIRRSFIAELKVDYNLMDEEKLRDNLVKSAMSYIGTQYRWGGKSPLGIDCSGLCSMAYMLNGIIIYRDAKIKEKFPVKEICFDKAKKGDLLYFKGHIAMYLGNGRYIHSSNSNDCVKINSFNKNDENYFEKLDNKLLMTGSIF